MFEIIGVAIWILAGIRWGDWKNWALYQPTIIYFILCDVLYYYITYNHPLWDLEPTWPLKYKLVSLFGEFLVFASTILLYIGRFPTKRWPSLFWIVLWVVIYTISEWVLWKFGVFSYHNNWNLFDSFLFNFLLFLMLRLYYRKPLTALLLSVPICIILIMLNSVPLA